MASTSRADVSRPDQDRQASSDLPLVATNDLHYTNKEDNIPQEVLLCVQTGATPPTQPVRFEAEEFYLKSPAEMRDLFGDYQSAGQHAADRRAGHPTTSAAATCCQVPGSGGRDRGELATQRGRGGGSPPVRRPPQRRGPQAGRFRARRHPADGLPGVVPGRRRPGPLRKGERHPGRAWAWFGRRLHGAYCLGITELDPLKYGLIFERFLNPERVAMPDIEWTSTNVGAAT